MQGCSELLDRVAKQGSQCHVATFCGQSDWQLIHICTSTMMLQQSEGHGWMPRQTSMGGAVH